MAITKLTLIFEYEESIPRGKAEEYIIKELEHAKKYPSDFVLVDNLVGIDIQHGKVKKSKRRKRGA